MAGGEDLGELITSLATGNATGDEVAHQVVDLGQDQVVDLTSDHPPDLDGGGLVDARLVVHRQVDEGHVGGHLAYAASVSHGEHGGGDIGRPGPR